MTTIIDQEVDVGSATRAKKHLLDLCYRFQDVKPHTVVTVRSVDPMPGSGVVVGCLFDGCDLSDAVVLASSASSGIYHQEATRHRHGTYLQPTARTAAGSHGEKA